MEPNPNPSIEWKMGPLVVGIRADSKWPFGRAESESNGTENGNKDTTVSPLHTPPPRTRSISDIK
jgi:hypothetical protein